MGFFNRKPKISTDISRTIKRNIYEAELRKQQKKAAAERGKREIDAIRKMAKEDAYKNLHKPSRTERIANIGASMQQASDDYLKFFGPSPQTKKKKHTDIPSFY